MSRLHSHRLGSRRAAVAAALLTLLVASSEAHAVVRTCGGDAIANTATVLCAPPSGPCDANLVVVSTTLRLANGVCDFDLAGRDLRIERTVRMVPSKPQPGDGVIHVKNAGDITVARSGKLLVRGQFPFSRISLMSQRGIVVGGVIDVGGARAGGEIDLTAPDQVTLEKRSRLLANGVAPLVDRFRESDGGSIEIIANSAALHGEIAARGAVAGGFVDVEADTAIVADGRIDVGGGTFSGGGVAMDAGVEIALSGWIDASSRFGGSDGGSIELAAGSGFGDIVPARLTIDHALLDLSGSSANQLGGFGGLFDGEALGTVRVGADVVIRASASASFDGDGGIVILAAFEDEPNHVPAVLDVAASISARSGRLGGLGGEIDLVSEGQLVFSGDADVTGHDGGGTCFVEAGGDAVVAGPLVAAASTTTGEGGVVSLAAGQLREGTLMIADDITASGKSAGPPAAFIEINACRVHVDEGVTLDGGTHAASGPGGGVRMVSGLPLQLGAGSRYLAGPDGAVTTTHPPGADPVIGPGVVFDPSRIDDVVATPGVRNCPHCGPNGDESCDAATIVDVFPGRGASLRSPIIE